MSGSEEEAGQDPGAVRVLAAELPCPACGTETPHRVLRIDPRSGHRPGTELVGVARCRECRLTHPFTSTLPRSRLVPVVISEGSTSVAGTRELPSDERIAVGALLPESDGVPMKVLRVDRRDGGSSPSSPVAQIETLWLSPYRGERVSISLVEGRRTRSLRTVFPKGRSFSVGGSLRVEGRSVRIVALRARGRTWREAGDAFPSEEVDRIYARRIETPPAGRSPWIRVRESPSSRASSTSRSARSRSSPGTSTNRG